MALDATAGAAAARGSELHDEAMIQSSDCLQANKLITFGLTGSG